MRRFFENVAATRNDCPSPEDPYSAWHAWSCANPVEFWAQVWSFTGIEIASEGGTGVETVIETGAGVRAVKGSSAASRTWAPNEVLLRGETMQPPGPNGPEWFPRARLNFAEHLLRRRGSAAAIIARAEGAARRELSFDETADVAGLCAAALERAGIQAGDRVAGFMPNVPETVLAMLGTAWIGAMWTSCSPDFGVKGVLDRFGQVEPRVLVCVDGYRYGGKDIDTLGRVREIVDAIATIEVVVVVPFLRAEIGSAELAGIRGAVSWSDWIGVSAAQDGTGAGASRSAPPPFARLPFNHPLYVMYSSGTTGLPKCMVHGAGGTLIQHLKEHQLHCDIGDQDRVFYFTTCGWMMWNWLVSALGSGAAIVLYDGAPMPPADAGALWRMAAEERVTVFGTSAKFIAASENAGVAPAREYSLGSLRMILSTGSPLAHHGFDYVMRDVCPGVHLASISGGTDLIACFVLGNPLLPVWRGEIQCAGLGMAVDVLDDDGRSLRGAPGELVCTRPFPSMPVAFWNDSDGEKYRAAYFSHFPGVWRHGDWVEWTTHDGFVVHGRSDATLNPGGVRIGTAEIYREVEQVAGVLESVVVGQDVSDGSGTDTRIVLFVRLAPGVALDDALRERIRERVRAHTSPHHVPKIIAEVPDIPRTISGKITEIAVRDVIHGRAVKNTEALANPGALEYFRDRAELGI